MKHICLNIWIVSRLCQLWIKLWCTLTHRFLCKHKISVHFSKYWGVTLGLHECVFNLISNNSHQQLSESFMAPQLGISISRFVCIIVYIWNLYNTMAPQYIQQKTTKENLKIGIFIFYDNHFNRCAVLSYGGYKLCFHKD